MQSRLEVTHYHLSVRSIDGAEWMNVYYDNPYDAAADFIGVARRMLYGVSEPIALSDVIQSFETGSGMYIGTQGIVIMLRRCASCPGAGSWN